MAESENYMDNEKLVDEFMFKLIVKKSVIDTIATSTYLRENLTNLDIHITTVNSDIEHFNQYVKVNMYGLKARGERTDDLMINLFKAYQVASDGEFVRYIITKRDQYDYGYNISTDKLMTYALNKFEIPQKENKWKSRSSKQEHSVALAFVIEKLKDERIKPSKIFKTSSTGKGKFRFKVKRKGKGQKQSGKQSQYGKGEDECNKRELKYLEENTKIVNNKTYFWFPTHKVWNIHRPKECTIKTEQVKSTHQSNYQRPNTKALVRDLVTILSEINSEYNE